MAIVKMRNGACSIFLYLILTLVSLVSSNSKVDMLQEDMSEPHEILRKAVMDPLSLKHASPECKRAGELYEKDLKEYKSWALQMYDASAKIPSGIITGNIKQLGNFDQCLTVRNDHGFAGQACQVIVRFNISNEKQDRHDHHDLADLLVNVAIASNSTRWKSGFTVNYEWMWCVPSTCNDVEIEEAIKIVLDKLKVDKRVDVLVTVSKKSCYTEENTRISWDSADICYTLICALFALIIIASTIYDVATQRSATLNREVVLSSFSLYTNGKNLLETNRSSNPIECLDGLRFLSICWIIFGHNYYLEVVGVKLNLTNIPQLHYYWPNMLVLNANIVTDTFLLLTGTLLSYTELSKKEHMGTNWRFDLLGHYVYRYIRLTPAYAMLIGFYATLFYKFGTGPHWNTWVGSSRDACRTNWWTNLLYINNYVNVPNMCMSQSWYLSTDMQLNWLSPLILYPMFSGYFFNGVFSIILILSVLVTFLITYINNLTGTMLYYKEQKDLVNYYLKIYTKTHSRFGPYVIGLGLGYLLYKTRSSSVKMSIRTVVCGWLLAIALGLLVVFLPRIMYFEDYTYNKEVASLYASLHRHVFVLSISWIIFCCVHGYGGPVNHILSWYIWIPLSKLTYCAYLTHYVFLLSDSGSVRTTGDLSMMKVVRIFFGNLMFTMIFSALWSLFFEIPFVNLAKVLRLRWKQKSSGHNKSIKLDETEGSVDSLSRSDKNDSSKENFTNGDNAKKLIEKRKAVAHTSIENFDKVELEQL